MNPGLFLLIPSRSLWVLSQQSESGQQDSKTHFEAFCGAPEVPGAGVKEGKLTAATITVGNVLTERA